MTFDIIQDRIAAKIAAVNAEITRLESIDTLHAALDARLRMLIENADFLEMLAFFIINQDEQIGALTEQTERLQIRVAALLNISERTTRRANASQAVTALFQSKYDRLNSETDIWLKHELGNDDYNSLTQKIAA